MSTEHASSTSGRIQFIDTTRGLFIYWMVCAHALTLSNIDKESWVNYIRPPGWATSGFVILSGFSVAVILMGRNLTAFDLQRRARRRAIQLFAYALLTELMSRAISDALVGTISLQEILSPDRLWSISVFLIPPAMLLGIVALAAHWLSFPKPGLAISCILASVLVIETASHLKEVLRFAWLWDGGVLGISLLNFLLLALTGAALGQLFKDFNVKQYLFAALPAGLLLLLLNYATGSIFAHYLGAFCISLSIGLSICLYEPLALFRKVFAMMGRSALLLFIAHRLILQCQVRLIPLSGKLLFFIIVPVSLLLMIGVCLYKERAPNFAHAMHRLGL